MLILINSFAPAAFAEQRGGNNDVNVDALNFPDEEFRNWILDGKNLGSAGEDGVLSEDEILSITEINLSSASGGNIVSLEGISHFTELNSLVVSNHQLTSLDVSSNVKLEYLNCSGNRLSSLKLGSLPKLKMLNCSENYLTTVDLENCPSLENLYLSSNRIETIDLSNNASLINVDLFGNVLERIELSALTSLQTLVIDSNKLQELDLGANSDLKFFSAQYNLLVKIILPNAPDLNVSFDCFSEQDPETGYDLVKWYEDDMFSAEIKGDVTAQGQTLYGKRLANTYKIVFNPNGGKGSMENQNGVYGEELELSRNTFTRYGYYFSGWNTAPGGNANSYSDSQRVQNIGGKTNGESVYLYAQWSPNKYTVKYDSNHAEAQGSMNDSEGYFDRYLSLQSNGFTNSRFDFIGWGTSPDGPVLYADGASVLNLSAENGSTVTLYAVWSLKASELQKPFMDKIQEEFRLYQNGDYTDEDWQLLAEIYSIGAESIVAADKDTDKMQTALDNAVRLMKAVYTYELRLAEVENGWNTEHGDVLEAVNKKPMNISNAEVLATRIKAAAEKAKKEALKAFSTLNDPDALESVAVTVSEKLEKTILEIECLERSVLWYNSLGSIDSKPLREIRSTHLEIIDAKKQEYNALGEDEKEYIPVSVTDALSQRRELSAKKGETVGKIHNEYSKYDLEKYSQNGQSGLKFAFESGIAAVEQSASHAEIEKAFGQSVANMNSVLTLEQEENSKPVPEEQPGEDQNNDTGSNQDRPSEENNSNNNQNENTNNNTSSNNGSQGDTVKPADSDKTETPSAQSVTVSNDKAQTPAEQAQVGSNGGALQQSGSDSSDNEVAFQDGENHENGQIRPNNSITTIWLVTAVSALLAAGCAVIAVYRKRLAP